MKKIVSIITICALVFSLLGCVPKVELTETENIETKQVATVWSHDDMAVIDAMKDNDATFFIVENTDDDNWTIYQINKAAFSEKESLKKDEAVSEITNSFGTFLNTNYKNIGVTYGQSVSQGGAIFDGMGLWGSGEEIDDEFNGGLASYFESHELELSCEDFKVKKIGLLVYDYINDKGMTETEHRYYFIGEGNVKTVNAVGDLSDLDYFAKPGETKMVTLSGTLSCFDWWEALAINYMHVN